MPSKPSGSADTIQAIAGRIAVAEALERDGSAIDKVLLAKKDSGKALRVIADSARKLGIPVQYVPETKLSGLSGGANHQGIVALISPVAFVDVDTMLSNIGSDLDSVRKIKPLVVILDRIEDPQNYGAIVRSVVGCGAAGVIVPSKQMAPVNAHAIKASAGAILRIPMSRVSNLTTTIEMLKERGYWIVGADGDGKTTFQEMDWDRPLALVIGNEHAGLSAAVKSVCDYTVSIPLSGDIESLNASVAAGILLFAARGDKKEASSA
ncbi:MAG: 23S rRNA (guanosine(2251)-2'-O)-methyltransferase RlmB [Rhodothermales bacterium]|nr:23S rRNA (guanosine(2251)-2'-O)-methyltransferase RlmB [Rhodothermales bacterium]